MALHLNFYHEIQKDEQVRARDPIKLAGLAAAGVALLLLGYYFFRLSTVKEVESRTRAVAAEWRDLEPKQLAAQEKEKELLVLQEKNAAIQSRLEGRFYWGPVLQQLAEATPEMVQITALDGKITDETVMLLITGHAAGEQPRLVAEQFRAGLEDKLEGHYAGCTVRFDGSALEEVGRQVELGGKALPIVRFTVRALFESKAAEKPEQKPETQETAP